MKSMIQTYSQMVFLLMLLASCFCINANAQDETGEPSGIESPLTFISEIAVDTKRLATDKLHYIPDNGYTLIDKDLNKGCSGSDYVYLGYKTTHNPLEAITDIIIVQDLEGSEYRGDNNKTITLNGKTYHAAHYGKDSKGGNLTRGIANMTNIYLYYTKDRNSAGISLSEKPIQSIEIVKRDENRLAPSEVGQYATMLYVKSDGKLVHFDKTAGFMGGAEMALKMSSRHTHEKSTDPNEDGLYYCRTCWATFTESDIPQRDIDGFYGIRNAGHLLWFINYVNSDPKHCNASARLYEDIDLTSAHETGAKFDPIGSGAKYFKDEVLVNWTGTFDGNGRTISHLKQDGILNNGATTDVLGFIGVANGCTVKNLKLKDVDLSCTYQGTEYGPYAAGIIGYLTGGNTIVEDCEVSGTIKALAPNSNKKSYAAGIIFSNGWSDNNVNLKIKDCINNANVTSSTDASGILCVSNYDQTAEIEQCENNGNVTSERWGALAIADAVSGGYVKNCLNTGVVRSYNSMERVGGYNHTGYFCSFDGDQCTNNLVLTGCDYMETSAAQLLQYKNYKVGDTDADNISTDECKVGKACFLLNNESTADTIWTQHLGAEDYPLPHKREYAVARYTKYVDGSTPTDHYTNYLMYADDVNTVHRWKESYVAINEDMNSASVDLKCDLCDLEKQHVRAVLVEQRRIKDMLCDKDAVDEYTFQTEDEADAFRFSVTRVTPNKSKKAHANYAFDNTLGATVCTVCGHVSEDNPEKPELVDDVALISKPGHLLWLNRYVQEDGSHYTPEESHKLGIDVKLMNDIDLTPLITKMGDCPYFIYHYELSTFDGNGHTVKGYYNHASGAAGGFFRLVSSATVKNLTIEGSVKNENGGAILCYDAKGSIIENCTVRGKITCNGGAAGLCYSSENSDIHGCRNFAEIQSANGHAGGIAANFISSKVEGDEISKCANYGDIAGSSCVGGIVGSCLGSASATDCANFGKVDAQRALGGIAGKWQNSQASGAETFEARYAVNVGKVTIHAEYNAKGGLFGSFSSTASDDHMEAKQFYYTNVPVAIGEASSDGKIIQNNVHWVTEEKMQSQEICAALNYVDGFYFESMNPEYASAENNGEEDEELYKEETDFINKNKAVWEFEKIGDKNFPSPFGTKKREIVNLNGGKLYVIEGETLERLSIEDGFYFNSPTTFFVKDLVYNRSSVKVKKDFYATVNLPFSFSDNRLKIFAYDHYDKQTGRIYLKEVEQTEPETPYMVRLADNSAADEAELIIKAENAGIAKSVLQFPRIDSQIPYMATGFYGTYAKQKVVNGADGFYCFSTKYGDFRKANTTVGTKVGPFRAVFKIKADDDAAAIPAYLKLYEGESGVDPTGIDASMFYEGDASAPIYNMNGQRIANSDNLLPSGIYVKGGKKIIVK